MKMNRDVVRAAVERYLEAKNVVLWQSWDLTRPESFNAAVDWLTDTWMDVASLVVENPIPLPFVRGWRQQPTTPPQRFMEPMPSVPLDPRIAYRVDL